MLNYYIILPFLPPLAKSEATNEGINSGHLVKITDCEKIPTDKPQRQMFYVLTSSPTWPKMWQKIRQIKRGSHMCTRTQCGPIQDCQGAQQGCKAMLSTWTTRSGPTQCPTEEVSTVDHRSPCSLLSPGWSATQLPGESGMSWCQSTSCLTFKSSWSLNTQLPDCPPLVWTPAMKKLRVEKWLRCFTQVRLR